MDKIFKLARRFEVKYLSNRKDILNRLATEQGPREESAERTLEQEEQEREQAKQAYNQNRPFVQDAAGNFISRSANPKAYVSVAVGSDNEKFFPIYQVTAMTDEATKQALLKELQTNFANFRFELL